MPRSPKVNKRRPYDYSVFKNKYMESDRDYINNNYKFVMFCLDNAELIKKALTSYNK